MVYAREPAARRRARVAAVASMYVSITAGVYMLVFAQFAFAGCG